MGKRRGAIVGYGFIAERGHVPAYKDSDLEIVAIADVCAARREAAAKALPGVRLYEDHETLIAKEKGEIEFVDVSAPPYAHAKIADAALDAGLHVLCEKPLATRPEDARGLLAHAEKARRVLFPSHNYRHAPVIKAVRQVIDAGLIGKVHYVTLDTFRNTHARGVREWNENWRRQMKYSGGGIAMDHGSHTFYLAFEWLRSYPTAISAKMSHGDADTEHSLSATITFPTGTAVAQLTWTAGIRKVIYTVHGDKGAIRVEDDDVEVAVMGQPREPIDRGRVTWEMKKERVASDWMDASHVTWFGSLFERFGTAIDKREYVGKDAEDALACVELITAAYASAKDGCREQALGQRGRD
jgi:predicted dehydrogenase